MLNNKGATMIMKTKEAKKTYRDLPDYALEGLVTTILDMEKSFPDFPRTMIVETYVDLWFGVEVPTNA